MAIGKLPLKMLADHASHHWASDKWQVASLKDGKQVYNCNDKNGHHKGYVTNNKQYETKARVTAK